MLIVLNAYLGFVYCCSSLTYISVFAICLRFLGFCLGDEVALGAGRNCCGELMLGSEYVLADDPDVESISNLWGHSSVT